MVERFSRVLAPALALSLCVGSVTRAADVDKAALAQGARQVFATYCHKCHGENGRADGNNLNFVLDLKKLVDSKRVVPGNARGSKLFKRLTSQDDPMPPESDVADTSANPKPLPRPAQDEVDKVRRWIEAGAPDVVVAPGAKPRPFLTESDIVQAIDADLRTIDPRYRGSARYFTITHLHNAGLSPDELLTYRNGLSKLMNSLSSGRRIVAPRPIDPAGTIFRIDLRDFKWDEKIWQAILAAYPYGLTLDTEPARATYTATRCELPYVRADWFVFAASKPPLYHDVLQLPKTDRELEANLHIDVAGNIRQDLVARAGFNGSRVSIENNRMIERHESDFTNGAYWKSYDFAVSKGRKNIFAFPLGPGPGPFAFEHDGGEIIFNLPNGLQAYMLVNASGQRLDVAPTAIVRDNTQPRGEVVNGISCMRCHARGIIEKDDQVAPHVAKFPAAYPTEVSATVRALYPAKSAMDALYKEDNDRFALAMKQTGATLSSNEPVFSLARKFEGELDLALAASESGADLVAFERLVRRNVSLSQTLGVLFTPGGTVKRDVFNDAFPAILSEMGRRALHPGMDAVAYYNRAIGLANAGEYGRALADFNEALRLDPNDASTLNEIAWLLATCPNAEFRDGRKAMNLAFRALQAKVNDKEVYLFADTYAAALAESGEFTTLVGAVQWQTNALRMIPQGYDKEAPMRERLELYKAGKPYRDSPRRP